MSDVSFKANKLPQFVATIAICIGAIGCGTVTGWTSNITSDLQEGKLNNIKMSREDLSWTGSLITLGACIMCFITAIIADLVGRKLTVLATSVPLISGWLLVLFGKNLSVVFVGRTLSGMANGAFSITAPLYTSEIAQKEIRGILGTFYQLFFTTGILYANIVGKFASMTVYIILCLAIPVVFSAIFIFLPETPVYLLKKNKQDKAVESLTWFRGKKYDTMAEIHHIQEVIDKEKENNLTLCQLMQTREAKKATLICFSLMFYQKLGGINAFFFYSQDIFEAAGSALEPKTSTIVVGTVQAVSTAFATVTIDKLGRKILLIASDAGMSLGSFTLGLYFLLKNRNIVSEDTINSIGFIPVVALIVFVVSFSIGFGPIAWIVSSELFAPGLMAKVGSFAAAFNWFWAFMVTKYYITVAGIIGNDVTFFMFTGMSISGIFFVWLVMPETKNKTLEEVQAELAK